MPESRSPITWSLEATEDIDHLWDHYADVAGRGIADKILREIARIVATIDDFPFAGRCRDEIRAGLRSLVAGSQIVFYRLKDGRPEIVRVLDGRQDIDQIFSEEDDG